MVALKELQPEIDPEAHKYITYSISYFPIWFLQFLHHMV